MNRTTVSLALTGCIAICSCALAQGPVPIPIPEGVPTVGLEEFLQRVAASTDTEFLIDIRSRQNIYVGGTQTEDVTYPILLSILRNNQLMAVEIQGRVNIVPEAFARQMPVRLVQQDDPDVADDEVVSRVIQMNNMNAAQAVPILRALLPQYAHLAALPDQNKLLIVDRYANVRRLTEILNALDN